MVQQAFQELVQRSWRDACSSSSEKYNVEMWPMVKIILTGLSDLMFYYEDQVDVMVMKIK